MLGKKLFSFVEVDDNTPIQKLSVADQIRVAIKKLSKDDAAELEAEDALTYNYLVLQANLNDLIDTALKPVRQGKRSAVSISLSNKFDSVLEEVLDSPSIKEYYNTRVTRPNVDFDIPYFIRVDLEVKRI